MHSNVLVLGSGPAGATAAIYAARANLGPIVFAGMRPGGQLTITTDVENFPGFVDAVQGPWLMEQMRGQAERAGARFVDDEIAEVDLTTKPFRARTDGGAWYTGDTIILATGATAQWLGLESEHRLKGFGVSACATCDAFFFRGKAVAVVGGGNTAVEEALHLARHASSVTLVHRRDRLRAEKVMQDRLFADPRIDVRWNVEVEEISGQPARGGVDGVVLRQVHDGTLSRLCVDGVFVAIGHSPSTGLFEGKIDMDAAGYIVTEPGSTRTSVAGVFAAGDVQDRIFRQAVTAAGSGCQAALEAERYLTM